MQLSDVTKMAGVLAGLRRIGLSDAQYANLTDAMAMERDQIDALMELAGAEWDSYMNRGTPPSQRGNPGVIVADPADVEQAEQVREARRQELIAASGFSGPRLHSHTQWYAAKKGREMKIAGATEDISRAWLGEFVKSAYLADAERFFWPAFRGETIPDLDGPDDCDEALAVPDDDVALAPAP